MKQQKKESGIDLVSKHIADCLTGEIYKQQRDELLDTLKNIIEADKTRYEYTGRHAEKANGDKPAAGKRWATPAELAKQAIAKHTGDV